MESSAESSGSKTVLKAPMTAKVPSRWPGKCGPVWPGPHQCVLVWSCTFTCRLNRTWMGDSWAAHSCTAVVEEGGTDCGTDGWAGSLEPSLETDGWSLSLDPPAGTDG